MLLLGIETPSLLFQRTYNEFLCRDTGHLHISIFGIKVLQLTDCCTEALSLLVLAYFVTCMQVESLSNNKSTISDFLMSPDPA